MHHGDSSQAKSTQGSLRNLKQTAGSAITFEVRAVPTAVRGEALRTTFHVKNQGPAPVYYTRGDYNPLGVQVLVFDGSGKSIPGTTLFDQRWKPAHRSRIVERTLHANSDESMEVDLTAYFDMSQPGRYRIKCKWAFWKQQGGFVQPLDSKVVSWETIDAPDVVVEIKTP